MKCISWKDPSGTLTAEERSCLFEKKQLPACHPGDGETPKQESRLSQLLEEFSKYGENPFTEFAKFDGRSSVSFTKKIDIFLTMAPSAVRVYPMMVNVVASAKVQDLIGLICWQHTSEGRAPKLQYPVNHYCLYIAEDDGEVDWDFPSLDNRKPVLRFGFGKLALVPKDSIVVTINGPNEGFNKFQVESLNISMRSILEKVINRRKIRTRPGVHYNLEKQSLPGVAVDLDSTLGHMDTMEFCLVRENSEEQSCMFEKKEVPVDGETPKQESKLSQLLEDFREYGEDFSEYGENPFLEYAKFDGQSSVSSNKKIDIFLTMAPPTERVYPMTVVVVASAKVQDLIGLICWQYTNERREPKLQHPVNHYCLHIAEDDGEADWDFPSLGNRKPVLKFGFGKLALVPKDSIVVTINGPNEGFSKFQVESLNIPMRSILEKVINRCRIRTRPGVHFNLEKQSQPGVAVDLDSTLGHMDTMEFCLVRENSTPGDLMEAAPRLPSNSLTSHQYRSFMVLMVHRLRPNTEVQLGSSRLHGAISRPTSSTKLLGETQDCSSTAVADSLLGISDEKVEIDPVQVRSLIPFIQQKAVTHEVNDIADCELQEKKSNGRAVFRLIYLTEHNYKHHDFEADLGVALKIVVKLRNILELRMSPTRRVFISMQESKLRKLDSLRFK